MKGNYLFVLFLCLISTTSRAQSLNYQPFDLQNSIWEEWYYDFIQERERYNYFTNGDTTINNLVYQKLYISGQSTINFYSSPPFPTLWTDFTRLEAYIRENSNKQVYAIQSAGGSEKLLYDFNLALGDSIKVPSFHFTNLDSAVVIAIDSILVCSTMRNRYLLAPIGTSVLHPLYWTEGIGSSHGLFPRYEQFESGTSHVCFSDSNCPPCALILSNTTKLNNEITSLATSYPNPTSTKTYIQLNNSSPLTQIKVLNNLGQAILSQTTNHQEVIIDSEEWPKGIYFIVIEQEHKKQTLRLIKN